MGNKHATILTIFNNSSYCVCLYRYESLINIEPTTVFNIKTNISDSYYIRKISSGKGFYPKEGYNRIIDGLEYIMNDDYTIIISDYIPITI